MSGGVGAFLSAVPQLATVLARGGATFLAYGGVGQPEALRPVVVRGAASARFTWFAAVG